MGAASIAYETLGTTTSDTTLALGFTTSDTTLALGCEGGRLRRSPKGEHLDCCYASPGRCELRQRNDVEDVDYGALINQVG